ncbi:hypothetical protein BpHYR1_012886 [Brachionus plicatilis]|uniref:Uncharacterized protein n=1 Tax=Brachionus plicatilis TaxID=10195 RepID=A0A3M7QGZ8_BRAPC|nr:hypothetical protein BpHYR1_012886 [Brachionus plicatilis]
MNLLTPHRRNIDGKKIAKKKLVVLIIAISIIAILIRSPKKVTIFIEIIENTSPNIDRDFL